MHIGANPLAAINSVALAIGRFSSLDEMLEYALGKVLEVVQAEAGGVYLLDDQRQELDLVVHRGLSKNITQDLDRLKLGEGLSGKVTLTGEPIIIRSLHDDPRVTRHTAAAEGFRGFAAVHCLGILTSIFSGVLISRGIVNLWYGRKKRLTGVSIGQVWKPNA